MDDIRNYLNTIRREFTAKPLDEEDVDKNPVNQLNKWLEEAIGSQILDPFTMVLSTVSEFGNPSSRVVYLRDISDAGMVFYTNYNSAKAKDIMNNPNVSMLFHWGELERQVRVTGVAEKLNKAASDAYFEKRPRESQLGAWASDQSQEVASREEILEKVEYFKEKFNDFSVPRPDYWGGFIVKPFQFEFWQGRPGRLHDRIVFRQKEGSWETLRIAP